jgi:hypothetical protein
VTDGRTDGRTDKVRTIALFSKGKCAKNRSSIYLGSAESLFSGFPEDGSGTRSVTVTIVNRPEIKY